MKHEPTKTGNPTQKTEFFALKPYNHKQLADFYGVCWPTFQRWVKMHQEEIGRKQGHFYSVRQVLVIFKIFGMPRRFSISVSDVEEMFKAA